MADLPAVTRRARLAPCSAYRCAVDVTRGAPGDDFRFPQPPLLPLRMPGPPPPGCLLGVLGGASGGGAARLSPPAGLQQPEGGGSGASRRRPVVRYGTCQWMR